MINHPTKDSVDSVTDLYLQCIKKIIHSALRHYNRRGVKNKRLLAR